MSALALGVLFVSLVAGHSIEAQTRQQHGTLQDHGGPAVPNLSNNSITNNTKANMSYPKWPSDDYDGVTNTSTNVSGHMEAVSSLPFNDVDSFSHNRSNASSSFHHKNFTFKFDEPVLWRNASHLGPDISLRKGHSMNFYAGFVVLFGGCNHALTQCYNDMYLGRLKEEEESLAVSWESGVTLGMPPSPRMGHVAAVFDTVMYVWAGFAYRQVALPVGLDGVRRFEQKSMYYNDVYMLDFNLEKVLWRSIDYRGRPPPARAGSTATKYGHLMLIFGGGSDWGCFNDLYTFDTLDYEWSKHEINGTKPPARQGHTAAVHKGHFFIFGGSSGYESLNDLWQLDIHEMSWQRVNYSAAQWPPGRQVAGHLQLVGFMFVVGGCSYPNKICYNDVWAFDMKEMIWLNFTTGGEAPVSREGATLTMLSPNSLLLFGGGSADDQLYNTSSVIDLTAICGSCEQFEPYIPVPYIESEHMNSTNVTDPESEGEEEDNSLDEDAINETKKEIESDSEQEETAAQLAQQQASSSRPTTSATNPDTAPRQSSTASPSEPHAS
eukprot:GILK01005119.1.p1 GENE.GILK01005119.1~~GILK01005119.1.p1  ORF type:complete len:560 (+),score=64.29 GILK01005119.1:33-1682(+)